MQVFLNCTVRYSIWYSKIHSCVGIGGYIWGNYVLLLWIWVIWVWGVVWRMCTIWGSISYRRLGKIKGLLFIILLGLLMGVRGVKEGVLGGIREGIIGWRSLWARRGNIKCLVCLDFRMRFIRVSSIDCLLMR